MQFSPPLASWASCDLLSSVSRRGWGVLECRMWRASVGSATLGGHWGSQTPRATWLLRPIRPHSGLLPRGQLFHSLHGGLRTRPGHQQAGQGPVCEVATAGVGSSTGTENPDFSEGPYPHHKCACAHTPEAGPQGMPPTHPSQSSAWQLHPTLGRGCGPSHCQTKGGHAWGWDPACTPSQDQCCA